MTIQVAKAAVDAYATNGGRLVAEVSLRLEARPDREELIGANSPAVMEANHWHHHKTMVTVMRLGAWSILDGVVPWVYRTYLARGFSGRYFLEEFDAWKRALAQCLPLRFSAELSDIYDWFEAQHDANLAQSQVWTPPPLRVSKRWAPLFKELVDRLIHGDADAVIRMADANIGSAQALLDFYFGALGPALHEIGRRWESGVLSVAREHLATVAAHRTVTYWYRLVLEQERTRGRAIVTTSPDEHHGLGSSMLADALAIDGWQVRSLGCDTPIDDLLALCRDEFPDLLAISVTMPFNLLKARDLVKRFRQQANGKRCRVLVGGQAFAYAPDVWRRMGADGWAPTAEAGVAMARA